MFDIWWGDIELTRLMLIISVALLLPMQLFFCFKVKNLTIRLLPIVRLSIFAAAFIIMNLVTPGWGGVVYLSLAIFAGFMIFMCGIGWGIWAIIKCVKRNN